MKMHTNVIVTGFLTFFLALTAAQAPLLPSQDPFYVQPKNISAYNLGDVVRSRDVTRNVNGLSQNFVTINVRSATQFMYRTNDSLANPVAAVMTFLTPSGSNANSSRLLAYSTAYDSANNNCSPSYSIQKGANNTIGPDITFISAALNNGWYVVTSDFEGLRAQFVAGIMSGHGVLDSIKASLTPAARAITGLSINAQYALFGYSGGALASEWAAEMAPTYAPTLKRFVGIAIGGLTPNITSVLQTVNGNLPAGLAFGGSQGLSNAYKNLSDFFDVQIKPELRSSYNTIAQGCLSQSGPAGAFKDFFSYLKEGRNILFEPVVQSVFSGAGQMGVHGIPRLPMYVYKALFDEVSPIQDTTQLVNKYCAAGARVQYTINPFGNHETEAFIGTPAAFQYIMDRFNGVTVSSGCSTQTISQTKVASAGNAISPAIIGEIAQALENATFF